MCGAFTTGLCCVCWEGGGGGEGAGGGQEGGRRGAGWEQKGEWEEERTKAMYVTNDKQFNALRQGKKRGRAWERNKDFLLLSFQSLLLSAGYIGDWVRFIEDRQSPPQDVRIINSSVSEVAHDKLLIITVTSKCFLSFSAPAVWSISVLVSSSGVLSTATLRPQNVYRGKETNPIHVNTDR